MTSDQAARKPSLIGVYVTLPIFTPFPSGNEPLLIRYLLTRPLRERHIFVEKGLESSSPFLLNMLENKVFAVIAVWNWRLALKIIADELNGLGLLENAQIAWLDVDEDIWRDYHPKSPATPFCALKAAACKWDELNRTKGANLLLVLEIAKVALLPAP